MRAAITVVFVLLLASCDRGRAPARAAVAAPAAAPTPAAHPAADPAAADDEATAVPALPTPAVAPWGSGSVTGLPDSTARSASNARSASTSTRKPSPGIPRQPIDGNAKTLREFQLAQDKRDRELLEQDTAARARAGDGGVDADDNRAVVDERAAPVSDEVDAIQARERAWARERARLALEDDGGAHDGGPTADDGDLMYEDELPPGDDEDALLEDDGYDSADDGYQP